MVRLFASIVWYGNCSVYICSRKLMGVFMAGRRIKLFLAVLVVFISFCSFSAYATTIAIDFNGGLGTGHGLISWAGGSAPLIGTNIPIVFVEGQNTPANDGNYGIVTKGVLNFTTGNLVSSSNGQYTFAAGGSISVTGAVLAAGITNTNTVLTSGSFDVPTIFTIYTNSHNQITGAITQGGGTDTKNSALLTYYGLINFQPTTYTFLLSEISSTIKLNKTTGTFTASTNSTDYNDVYPVPEPASLVLLGSGLIAVAAFFKKKM